MTRRLHAGLYEVTVDGKLWIIEHVSKSDGFVIDEWHCGPEDDPHADQFKTLSDAKESLMHFLRGD